MVGFGYDVPVTSLIIGKLTPQLNLKDYIYSVACEVWLWVLGMMFV